MILRRLCEAAGQFKLPPFGYDEGPVKWIVDLDADGRLLGFVSTVAAGAPKGRAQRGKEMLHPALHRTSGVAALLLADKASYVLAACAPDSSDSAQARTNQCHEAFTALVKACASETQFAPLDAVLWFIANELPSADLPEDLTPGDMVTYRVNGELLIDAEPIRAFWTRYCLSDQTDRAGESCECTVCGERKPLADTTPVTIKPVPGGQTSGCSLVSANASAFESYGRKGTLTSPICWDCARLHAQALNAMLADDSYTFRLQDIMAYVFWTRSSTGFSAARLLSSPDPTEVRRLLDGVFSGGAGALRDPEQFYALAISGSGGRVVIRDWFETTLGTVERHLARYFAALDISSGNPDEDKPLGLYGLTGALIPTKGQNPWKQLPHNIVTGIVNTALRGSPPPADILHCAVRRARSEQGVTRPRAALIKMSLMLSTSREEGFTVTPELNPEIEDPAYLCGRLMAILASVQSAAVPNAKATLVDRFYGTASTAPASVFGNLMRLSQAHLSKLRKERAGAHARLQEALEDVGSRLAEAGGFPTTLSLIDQGKFALGYYQQRAADHAAARAATAAKKVVKGDIAETELSEEE